MNVLTFTAHLFQTTIGKEPQLHIINPKNKNQTDYPLKSRILSIQNYPESVNKRRATLAVKAVFYVDFPTTVIPFEP